jgi:hypothetical protein
MSALARAAQPAPKAKRGPARAPVDAAAARNAGTRARALARRPARAPGRAPCRPSWTPARNLRGHVAGLVRRLATPRSTLSAPRTPSAPCIEFTRLPEGLPCAPQNTGGAAVDHIELQACRPQPTPGLVHSDDRQHANTALWGPRGRRELNKATVKSLRAWTLLAHAQDEKNATETNAAAEVSRGLLACQLQVLPRCPALGPHATRHIGGSLFAGRSCYRRPPGWLGHHDGSGTARAVPSPPPPSPLPVPLPRRSPHPPHPRTNFRISLHERDALGGVAGEDDDTCHQGEGPGGLCSAAAARNRRATKPQSPGAASPPAARRRHPRP